jgi:penicillin-binding protein 2
MADYISNPDEVKDYQPRFRIFYVAVALSLTIFISRLWFLQIIEGAELREFSEKNRIKQVKIFAPRGLVVDRDGQTLIENKPGFEAIILPQFVKETDHLISTVAPILNSDPAKLKSLIHRSRKQNGPFTPVKLKENLSREEVFRLKRLRLEIPGLDIRETVVRHYPLADNGSQMLGYVAEISKRQIPVYNQMFKGVLFEQGDIVGKTGIEEVLERDLRGQNGIQFIQVDAFGREVNSANQAIYGENISDKEPTPGRTVVLTIDSEVQKAAYESFKTNNRIGALVAMKSNGEVLAWISSPSYDSNQFSTGISNQLWSSLINDPFKPLRNKVVQDFFSPGSTFKSLVALAALEEKIISPNTYVNCPGQLWFGNRPYHDHVKGGQGNITVFEALERSSNVFFYKMGISLGIDRMHNYISLFGLGAKTGIELPREVAGTMPSSAWKKSAIGEEWQPGENLSVAIGQGFVQSTPLQMAVAYNAIGTEGKVVKPFIVKKLLDHDGSTLYEGAPNQVRDLTQVQPNGVKLSTSTFKTVKSALKLVVHGERGTAKFLKTPGIEIAGKTGTSQVIGFSASEIYAKCENQPIHKRHHGWFVAWAPADNPQITVAALAEHSCHGSTGAGPLVRDTIKAYFEKYHKEELLAAIEKDKKKLAKAPAAVEPVTVQEGE